MQIQSRKNKGRKLQQWICEKVLQVFPLGKRDVQSTSMGSGGADVKLSDKAYKLFPYNIEAKNQQKYKGIYDTYNQAVSHGAGEPLVIIKMNNKKPLAIVDAEHFIELAGKLNGTRNKAGRGKQLGGNHPQSG